MAEATPDAESFRRTCGQFATGVTVVTANSAEDGDCAVTVNSFTSLTLDPPQILVCLARTSNTWRAISKAGFFAVNVLSATSAGLTRRFASKDADKMAGVAFDRGQVGAPLLPDVLAHFECRLVDAIPRDSHVIVVGRVQASYYDDSRQPALFFRGKVHGGLPTDTAR